VDLSLTQRQALLAQYWGKADPAVIGRSAYHTVLGHSLDVAACTWVLVDRNPLLRAQLAAAGGLTIDATPLTFAALCALHDLGKLDTRFQRKAPTIADRLRPASAGIPTSRYDHGTEGFRQVDDDDVSSNQLKEFLGPHSLILLRAVCGHHGALPTRDEPDASRVSISRALRAEDTRARQTFVDLVIAFFASCGAQLPWGNQVDGATVQRLAGLCAVSDWLGSNVEHFPYAAGLIEPDTYWTLACERAAAACKEAGLLRAAPSVTNFSALFPGYKPRDVQTITESLNLTAPALVIVEAEMGKGKTEAALSMAAHLLSHGLGDGLTVALPTMATSNAMFDRINEVTGRLFEGGPIQLALAHGRASREPHFQRLIEHRLAARDQDATEASVMCARWLLRKKRILLAQVGVGTIDQALQAALVVRHQFVRMFGLSRNVVIIDEVHAYDAYMEVLLEHLLGWLGALRVPVVLLSATLPSLRRKALAQAWRGEGAGDANPADDLNTAMARPYPLVSVTTADGTQTHALVSEPRSPSRPVTLERCTHSSTDATHVARVAARLVAAAKLGGRVVWIRNTVREAQVAFRALAGVAAGVESVLFHARFRACDRSAVEQRVLRDFGKAGSNGGRVLIATQVVEQSLDLDFDELHTDLAPIDLLFQRTGRLHRHIRCRPTEFKLPRLVVHCPNDEDIEALRFGPSRFVYDAGTLWLAHRTLRSRAELSLPGDIRPLVEESYHPASRAALLTLGGEALLAAEQKREAILTARRTKARQCCIPPTTADPDGGSVLDDDDDAVQAFTRDGVSSTLLPFCWDGGGARALGEPETTNQWNLNPAASDAWRLASALLDQTLSLPARGEVEGSVPTTDSATWVQWKKRFMQFTRDCGLGEHIVPLPLSRTASGYKGWLLMGGQRRRVIYTNTLGLMMPSEKDDEQQR